MTSTDLAVRTRADIAVPAKPQVKQVSPAEKAVLRVGAGACLAAAVVLPIVRALT